MRLATVLEPAQQTPREPLKASAETFAWHAAPVATAFEKLATSREGLSAEEAPRRLAVHGPNSLPPARPKSALMRFLSQFNNLLIYVLLGSALITALFSHFVDMAVILAVVLANAAIGFVQEGRAERSLEAVRRMIAPHASVIRAGTRLTVPAAELVPGDLVRLEAGDRVPADLRIMRARSLRIDESLLTGESVPVDKAPAPVAAEAALGDRASMAYSGSLVTSGQGEGVVVATGMATELGRISLLLSAVEELTTPLLRQMNAFARQLTFVILSVSFAILAFAILVRRYDVIDAFMAVVSVAVAAIPEGLPAVLTITLAVGVQRMASRNAIIRRLPAVETLGAVSVICADKTGTFTRNEITVRNIVTADHVFEVTGVGYAPEGSFRINGSEIAIGDYPSAVALIRGGLLCNDATIHQRDGEWAVNGDPLEGALVSLAMKAGVEPEACRMLCLRIDEIPFDAAHRLMATLHTDEEQRRVIWVKGAPERLIGLCATQQRGLAVEPLDKQFWIAKTDTLAAQGQRVLAIAAKTVSEGTNGISLAGLGEDFTLYGLFGLIDPPREEAIAAVRECRTAGIAVKMITGDHAVTAKAVAGALGLARAERVATGHDLERIDNSALVRLAHDTDVFARTTPEHKLRLVRALQAEGLIVAMTGDGVNDAPALKAADIGVGMGRTGSEVAKEAAEMVLADDNFASIVAAVREGRTVHDNLRKVIGWTLPTSGGEALAIIAAILAGTTLPITPVQILWVNTVTAVALGLTLAFEPSEPDVMQRPPRPPKAGLLSRFLVWRVALVSLLMLAGVFGVFEWAMQRKLAIEEARTLVVSTVVVMEIFYLFSVRYLSMTSLSVQGVLGTPAVLLGVGAIVLAQLGFTYLPFAQRLFETRAIALSDGAVVVAIGFVLLVVLELEKLARRLLPR
jgi:magnesium-transporting ATPase (P-type)